MVRDVVAFVPTDGLSTVPLRADGVRQLPLRVPDPPSAGRPRPALRARRRLSPGGRAARRPARRRLRDARSGRPRLRPTGAGRGHGRVGVPAGPRGGRFRPRRARGRRGRGARQHARPRARDARPCAGAQRVRRRRQAAWHRAAVARVHGRLAPRRRRGPSGPACRRRYRAGGPGAVPLARPFARPARSRRRLSEPLRRLRVRARPVRESLLEHRLRASPQPGARIRRRGELCRRSAGRAAAGAGRSGRDRRRQPSRHGAGDRVSDETARLGLRANAAQFSLLVALNAFVGAMVGLERSVLPLVGERDFDLQSKGAILSFVVAFGIAKALANLAAGGLADRVGRKRLLVLGWALALPVPVLIALAPSWGWIVGANLLLGANQGLAWSMTVVMKIDLVGPLRRGLALGLNESAGYLGVAITAFATGALAASFAPRTLVWVGGAAIAALGTALSLIFVRDTSAHVAREQRAHGQARSTTLRAAFAGATVREPMLRACSQAGPVKNLNDALAWGLVPLYLAAHGASATEIGIVAGVYPAVWGAGQLLTGWLSDHLGRKPLITAGMFVQAGALALLVAGGGAFASALVAAVLLGVGTALVYPTLIAAVSDGVQPVERAPV